MQDIKSVIRGNNFNSLTEVRIHIPAESITLKIKEEVEGEIRSGLIKISNLTYTTPLMYPKDRNNYGLCAETKEALRVL